jgi:cell division protein FtsN
MLENQENKSVMHLNFSQVVIMWSVIAGLMVMSFLAGLYAGREQGLDSALEDYRQQGGRVQLATPQAMSDEAEKELLSLRDTSPSSIAAEAESAKVPISESDPNKDIAFDFSEHRISESEISEDTTSKSGVSEKNRDSEQKSKKVPSASDLQLFEKQETSETKEKPNLKQEKESILKKEQIKEKVIPSSPLVVKSKASQDKKKSVEETASKLSAGWYVQVAAARSMGQAESSLALCQKHGFKALIESAKVGNNQYYRVLVGPYSSSELASKIKNEVVRKKVSKTEPFLKRTR